MAPKRHRSPRSLPEPMEGAKFTWTSTIRAAAPVGKTARPRHKLSRAHALSTRQKTKGEREHADAHVDKGINGSGAWLDGTDVIKAFLFKLVRLKLDSISSSQSAVAAGIDALHMTLEQMRESESESG
eukprot:365417-Chlamydomonas_euryale.AAC.11